MLGIGMQEILIILVVALIVIGPKRLPELARTLGKGFAEFRKAADDLQETVRMDLQKEQQEEFRQKYPHLVPDEDEETRTQGDKNDEVKADADPEGGSAPVKTEPGSSSEDPSLDPDAMAGRVEEKPEPPPEPEPSYNPEEIEGGDDTEDDTRDG